MATHNTTVQHGRYVDTLEITVRKAIPERGESYGYAVEDRGGTRRLLVPETAGDRSFVVGRTYRIDVALGFDATFDDQAEFAAEFESAATTQCPSCHGDLVFEPGFELPSQQTVDFLTGQAGDQVSVVLTEESRVVDLSGDDWRLFQSPETPHPTGHEFCCQDCGLTIPSDQLERYLERDEAGESTVVADVEESNMLHSMSPSNDASLGMATGGAKDVDNFRENVAEGYLPALDSLTYEGLFYDYYYYTGDDRDGGNGDALFYPSYSTAVTDHPLTDETEHYLTVGLNSSLSVTDFERRRLNLVAVLDVSGSMGSQFDEYYYDEHGRRQETEDAQSTTKMEAATESLAALSTHLEPEDRFGVVLYNSQSHVAKPLGLVGDTDMDAIRGHIRSIRSGGGTNMSAGLDSAIDLLGGYDGEDSTEVENRLVFLTDMMPNTGETGKNAISNTIRDAADRGIYTTFVGMGLDENPDLAESLSAIRGANHYFVNSVSEFQQRLDDEFEYMVTPLVFDLQLDLEADVGIEAVYGSPNADRATGQLMHVATLFPSPMDDGETRGGIVLLQLDGEPADDLELVASWEEIDGSVQSDTVTVPVGESAPESFDTTGIQKAICLTRYASVLRDWIRVGRDADVGDDWIPMGQTGSPSGGDWEQGSVSLTVPAEFQPRFETLQRHIEATATDVDDETLQQEVELLDRLLAHEEPETGDLSKEDRTRLRMLVDLAPTTNGELAEAWGMDSGSAVHAYLESALGELYQRGEDGRIRPTERGLSIEKKQRS